MAAPPLKTERITRVLCNVVTVAKEAVGRRNVRRPHRENAECRLSTAPPAGCRLHRAARSHRAKAQCGDSPSSAVIHQHGTVRRRTTGRSSVLPRAAAFRCLCLTHHPAKPDHESHADDLDRPTDGRSCVRPPSAGSHGRALPRPTGSFPCVLWYGSRTRDSQISSLVLFPLS